MSRSSPRVILVILSLASFMASLDLFIVNVAFDDIGRSFGRPSLASLGWVLNGYAIVYAAMLVPLGRLADRFGRKAGFLLGVAVFTVASAACAFSPGLWWLVAFRVLQAVGAALLTPTSMGLLLSSTPPESRAKAVRIWAATGSLAAAAGPVAGGVLVGLSWHWVFLVNVPIGLLTLLAAARAIPTVREESASPIPDLGGATMLAISIGALSLALVEAPHWGWSGRETLIAFFVSAATLGLFFARSARHASPVIEPSLLRVRAFAWSNVAALTFSIGFAANLLANILWMQDVWHYSSLRTGLAIAPGPLMVPVFSAVAQRLARRLAIGKLAAAGCVLCGLGALIVLSSVGASPSYATSMLPGWMTFGAGVGLALPTMLSAATVDLPAARSATGSAIVNMGRQVGGVLGVSLLIALLGHPIGYASTHDAFRNVWLSIAATSLLAALAALGMTPRTSRQETSEAPLPLPSH